jgi:hypothetical protein
MRPRGLTKYIQVAHIYYPFCLGSRFTGVRTLVQTRTLRSMTCYRFVSFGCGLVVNSAPIRQSGLGPHNRDLPQFIVFFFKNVLEYWIVAEGGGGRTRNRTLENCTNLITLSATVHVYWGKGFSASSRSKYRHIDRGLKHTSTGYGSTSIVAVSILSFEHKTSPLKI